MKNISRFSKLSVIAMLCFLSAGRVDAMIPQWFHNPNAYSQKPLSERIANSRLLNYATKLPYCGNLKVFQNPAFLVRKTRQAFFAGLGFFAAAKGRGSFIRFGGGSLGFYNANRLFSQTHAEILLKFVEVNNNVEKNREDILKNRDEVIKSRNILKKDIAVVGKDVKQVQEIQKNLPKQFADALKENSFTGKANTFLQNVIGQFEREDRQAEKEDKMEV